MAVFSSSSVSASTSVTAGTFLSVGSTTNTTASAVGVRIGGQAGTGLYNQSGSNNTIWGAANGTSVFACNTTCFGIGDYSSPGDPSTYGRTGLAVSRGLSISKVNNQASSSRAGEIILVSTPDSSNYNIAGMHSQTGAGAEIYGLYWSIPTSNVSAETITRRLTLIGSQLLHGTTSASSATNVQSDYNIVSGGFTTQSASTGSIASGTYANIFTLNVSATLLAAGPGGTNVGGVWIVSALIGGTSDANNYSEVAMITAAPGGPFTVGATRIVTLVNAGVMDIRMDPLNPATVQVNQSSGVAQTIIATIIRIL